MKAAVCRAHGEPLVIEELAIEAPPGERGPRRARLRGLPQRHHLCAGRLGRHRSPPSTDTRPRASCARGRARRAGHLASGDRVVVTLIRSCGTCRACTDGRSRSSARASFRSTRAGPLRDADGAPVLQGLSTGAFAEQVVVHPSQVVAVPDDVAFVTASLLACGVITGVGAVVNTADVGPGRERRRDRHGRRRAQLRPGRGARAARAPIVAIDVADAKLDAARRFGATHDHRLVAGGRARGASRAHRRARGRPRLRHGRRPGRDRAGHSLMARGGDDGDRRHAGRGRHGSFDPGDLADRRPADRRQQDGLGPHPASTSRPRRPLPPGPAQARRAGHRHATRSRRSTRPSPPSTRGEALRNVIVFRT